MARSCIPGYDEAIAREAALREAAFLDIPYDICGIKCRNITPKMLAMLFRMHTPFFTGAKFSDAETLRFLWAVSEESTQGKLLGRERFIFNTHRRFEKEKLYLRAEEEIENFLDETFMDAPRGGKESVPYVTSIAWLVYTMAGEPFRWPEEKTLNTPLRKLYQYQRCISMANKGVLFNAQSDKLKADWLAEKREEILKARKDQN